MPVTIRACTTGPLRRDVYYGMRRTTPQEPQNVLRVSAPKGCSDNGNCYPHGFTNLRGLRAGRFGAAPGLRLGPSLQGRGVRGLAQSRALRGAILAGAPISMPRQGLGSTATDICQVIGATTASVGAAIYGSGSTTTPTVQSCTSDFHCGNLPSNCRKCNLSTHRCVCTTSGTAQDVGGTLAMLGQTAATMCASINALGQRVETTAAFDPDRAAMQQQLQQLQFQLQQVYGQMQLERERAAAGPSTQTYLMLGAGALGVVLLVVLLK